MPLQFKYKSFACKTISLLKLTSFLILMFSPSCYGAAEKATPSTSVRPYNILQAIMRIAVGQALPSREKTKIPENILQLVCQYAERKRVVTPLLLYYFTDSEQSVDCSKIDWLSRVKQGETKQGKKKRDFYFLDNGTYHFIERIMGADYEGRIHELRDPLPGPVRFDVDYGYKRVSTAFNEEHQGVWYAPGDIERFLSTECPNLDIKRATEEALKKYYERSKNDKPLKPTPPSLLKKGARFLAQKFWKPKKPAPLFLTQFLPPALHSIIFGYLQTTAQKNYVLMKIDEKHAHQIAFRPLIEGEEIVAIMGMDAHNQSHLLACALADPTKKDAEFLAELGEKTENGSIQKRTQEELLAVTSQTPSLFLVPSLAERFLTNKLTEKFLKEHAGISDQDLVLESKVLKYNPTFMSNSSSSAVSPAPVPSAAVDDNDTANNQDIGDGGPPGQLEDEEKS